MTTSHNFAPRGVATDPDDPFTREVHEVDSSDPFAQINLEPPRDTETPRESWLKRVGRRVGKKSVVAALETPTFQSSTVGNDDPFSASNLARWEASNPQDGDPFAPRSPLDVEVADTQEAHRKGIRAEEARAVEIALAAAKVKLPSLIRELDRAQGEVATREGMLADPNVDPRHYPEIRIELGQAHTELEAARKAAQEQQRVIAELEQSLSR